MSKISSDIQRLERDIRHHEQAKEAAQEELNRIKSLTTETTVVELLQCLVKRDCLRYGEAKVQVIKAVREATGLGLKEAKAIVDYVY